MNPPLAGLGVLLTRPAAPASPLLDHLARAGAEVHCLPVLALSPFAGPGLETTLALYPRADLAVFVSANAVHFGQAALAAQGLALHPGPQLAAVGRATARALKDAGGETIWCADSGSDSEALLALPRLQAVAGQTVLLFRGDSERGGRTLLRSALAERGASVHEAICYRREPANPDPAALIRIRAALADGRIQAVQVMSGESLDALCSLLPAKDLGEAWLIVPHPRVAAAAEARGLSRVRVAGFGDEALLATLATLTGSPRRDA